MQALPALLRGSVLFEPEDLKPAGSHERDDRWTSWAHMGQFNASPEHSGWVHMGETLDVLLCAGGRSSRTSRAGEA